MTEADTGRSFIAACTRSGPWDSDLESSKAGQPAALLTRPMTRCSDKRGCRVAAAESSGSGWHQSASASPSVRRTSRPGRVSRFSHL